MKSSTRLWYSVWLPWSVHPSLVWLDWHIRWTFTDKSCHDQVPMSIVGLASQNTGTAASRGCGNLGPGHTAAGFFDYHRIGPQSVKDTVAECGRLCLPQRESIICPKRQIIDSASKLHQRQARNLLRDAHRSERVKKQVVQFHLSLLEKETCSDLKRFRKGSCISGFRSS